MNEEQWLAAQFWTEVLSACALPFNSRKTQLWVVSVCRCVPARVSELEVFDALRVVEDFVDGRATNEAHERALDCIGFAGYYSMYTDPVANLASALDDDNICTNPYSAAGDYLDSIETNYNAPIAALVRDIFGNPFRPVAFAPEWRTADAVALARTMYDSREFGAMPLLADALQDAGCDNTDILDHCRDAKQVHVRGCWVVDLVLGKE